MALYGNVGVGRSPLGICTWSLLDTNVGLPFGQLDILNLYRDSDVNQQRLGQRM